MVYWHRNYWVDFGFAIGCDIGGQQFGSRGDLFPQQLGSKNLEPQNLSETQGCCQRSHVIQSDHAACWRFQGIFFTTSCWGEPFWDVWFTCCFHSLNLLFGLKNVIFPCCFGIFFHGFTREVYRTEKSLPRTMSFQPWHLKLRSHRGDDWVREYPEGSNFTVKIHPKWGGKHLNGEGGFGMVLGANCQHLVFYKHTFY